MPQEHPFAQYIRILGKGRSGSRWLTDSEAYNHPGYQPTHQQAESTLGFPHMAVIKEEGSEIAATLYMLGAAVARKAAERQAQEMWDGRNKRRFDG